MYSAFTLFHPLIYAVRGFPLFGRPGFHVCEEPYLGVLTRSSVLQHETLQQVIDGGVYRRRRANREEHHQFLTRPIRSARGWKQIAAHESTTAAV